MTVKAETEASKLDLAKWGIVLFIVGVGVYGNHFFAEYPLYLRALGELALLGVAITVALQTQKGHKVWKFLLESRLEIRKVVWPTRQETIQTTLIVIVMVVLTALFLWMLDGLLARIAAWLLS
jgi:preprotein translocase subunit SecE